MILCYVILVHLNLGIPDFADAAYFKTHYVTSIPKNDIQFFNIVYGSIKKSITSKKMQHHSPLNSVFDRKTVELHITTQSKVTVGF
jgi:hypothetical protein